MSFISVLAKENIITVMTDGQVTDSSGVSCADNFPKLKLINESQFIAVSGDYDGAAYLLNEIKFQEEKFSLEKVNEVIGEILLLTYNKGKVTNSVIIGGIDLDNQMKVYKLSIVNGNLESKEPLIPEGDAIVMAFLTSGKNKLSDDDVEVLFKLLLSEFNFDSSRFLDIQKIINDAVEENDTTVNRNTFSELIIR